MRSAYQIQPCLRLTWLDGEPARELAMISGLLDASPGIEGLVLKDLTALSRRRGSAAGRSERLTAEQVLRALLIKQRNGFTFRALAFHLADSQTYRTFCRLGLSDPNPSKSALAAAIKSVRSETLEAIHHLVLAVARKAGVEAGRKARIDCTVVESNIHRPMDSTLLGDGIRLVTRALVRSREQGVVTREGFANRTRRARRRSSTPRILSNARRAIATFSGWPRRSSLGGSPLRSAFVGDARAHRRLSGSRDL